MSNSRRNFLKKSSLLTAGSLLAPHFINGFTRDYSAYSGKRVVIIQLSGGNDGLNTVVPYRNDVYYKSRPRLGVAAKNVLNLNDELGFNSVMGGMRELYDDGLLSIINNVGYPNPDRSHFRSMDIWHTASDIDENWDTGWLGRYLDASCESCKSPYKAIQVEDNLGLVMRGKETDGLALTNPKAFLRNVRQAHSKELVQANGAVDHDNHSLGYLYKTLVDTNHSAEYIREKIKNYKSKANYPQGAFARDLKTIAELIGSGMETSVYYASLSGFDTHARQLNNQNRLLTQYSDAVRAFVYDLKSNDLLKDTLIMTFSEFGRRVAENASAGTDHGAANNLFVIGESVKAGMYNDAPDLQDLNRGDLKFEIDFRRVYATLLDKWLDTSSKSVLKKEFKPLNFI